LRGGKASAGWRMIKRTDERLVARGEIDHFPEPVVVKARRQRRRRAWPFPQRAPHEMLQQLEAADRGLHVPAVFASGQLVAGPHDDWTVHVMQWLERSSMRDRFLEGAAQREVEWLLERAGFSLFSLYLAGCNHIDFGPHAILMSDGSAEDDVIIDFEYATFVNQPSARILAAHTGYFGWSIATNRNWATHDQINNWFHRLFADCQLTVTRDYYAEFSTNLMARQSIRRRAARRP
jgi:hypothetical protein